MAYSSYNAFLSIRESTPTTSYKTQMQALINNQFTKASNYYVVKLKDRETGVYSDIGVRIDGWYAQTSTERVLHDDFKKIIFQDCDQQIYLGDIFEFANHRWMVINTDNNSSVTQSCGVQKCNIKLKFIESTTSVMPTIGVPVISLDGIADVKVYIPLEDRYILLPSNQMTIKIANDEDGRKIKDAPRGTRFLLGNPIKGWRVTGMDSISSYRPTIDATPTQTGIITLKMQSESINASLDNLTEGVAKQM